MNLKTFQCGKILCSVICWLSLFASSVRAQGIVREPWFAPVPPELATPAANYLYSMPVVVIVYLPTRDGVNLDSSVSGVSGTLEASRPKSTAGIGRSSFLWKRAAAITVTKTPMPGLRWDTRSFR